MVAQPRMGALLGGVGFGLVGAVTCDGNGGLFDPSPSECALGGALFGGGAGTLIGLGFGALVRTERREEVPFDRGRGPVALNGRAR